VIAGSCRYGQTLDEADGHYEETNAAGWDLVEDMMTVVGEITGSTDATEVNPDFPGWWQNFLPPGDLP
jgi:homoserine acetyltransferase